MSFFPCRGGGKAKISVETLTFEVKEVSASTKYCDFTVEGLGTKYILHETAFPEIYQTEASQTVQSQVSFSMPANNVLRYTAQRYQATHYIGVKVYLLSTK